MRSLRSLGAAAAAAFPFASQLARQKEEWFRQEEIARKEEELKQKEERLKQVERSSNWS